MQGVLHDVGGGFGSGDQGSHGHEGLGGERLESFATCGENGGTGGKGSSDCSKGEGRVHCWGRET
jgi:hypothetical protein